MFARVCVCVRVFVCVSKIFWFTLIGEREKSQSLRKKDREGQSERMRERTAAGACRRENDSGKERPVSNPQTETPLPASKRK